MICSDIQHKNTTHDISKLSQISRAVRRVKLIKGNNLEISLVVLCQISLQIMLLPILIINNCKTGQLQAKPSRLRAVSLLLRSVSEESACPSKSCHFRVLCISLGGVKKRENVRSLQTR